MSEIEHSITGWFGALRDGDDIAAEKLWNHYFARLTRLARRNLNHDAGYDEEDLAVSVFDALCRGAREGRFDELGDRSELWRLLVTIAVRKVSDRHRRQSAQRRGGTATARNNAEAPLDLLADLDPQSMPDWEASMADECRRLLEMLDDEQLRQIAVMKLDGHTNEEAGDQLGVAVRTVKRRLALIRKRWENELEQSL